MASHFAAAKRFTPAKLRTLFVKVKPAPANLTERRAVLRVLRQYTDIDVFKKLYDPSCFISVATSHLSALSIIGKSPFQFDYNPQQGHEPPGSAKASSPHKTFTVYVHAEPDYLHRTRIKESPIHGRWPQEQSLFHQTSFARSALRLAVPRDMAWEGLSDWETGGQLEGPDSHAALLSKEKHFIETRVRRKMAQPGFRSLTELYNSRHKSDKGQPEKQ